MSLLLLILVELFIEMDNYNDICILGVGVSGLDNICCIDKFPKENTKTRASHFESQGGGNVSNQLTAISRLGLKCKLLTALGNDSTGQNIKDILKSDGINIDCIYTIEGAKSPVSSVIVNMTTKTRTIMFCPTIDYDIEFPINDLILDGITWVHFDGRFHNTNLQIAQMAKKRNIPISIEAERCGLRAEELFKYAKIVFTSENFPGDHYGSKVELSDAHSRILSEGPEIVTTTLGDEGCRISCKNGDVINIPIFNSGKEIIDTTGAGDCFVGSFLYAYNTGKSISSAGKFANYMAAKKCEKIGARKGILYKKDIENYKFD